MRLLKVFTALTLLLFVVGCRDNLSPLSPRVRHQIDNTNGKIDQLDTVMNGVKVQMEGMKSQADVHARDIQAMQQGNLNKANSGVQVLQGDGTLIVILVLGVFGMFLVFYYRAKALKSEKTATILAQQIALSDDPALQDRVFMAALNSEVEGDVYRMIKKHTLMRQSP